MAKALRCILVPALLCALGAGCGRTARPLPPRPPPPPDSPALTEATTFLLKTPPHGRELPFEAPLAWRADAGATLLVSTNDLLSPPSCGRVEFPHLIEGAIRLRPATEHRVTRPFNHLCLYTMPSAAAPPDARVVVEYVEPSGTRREASEPFGPPGRWTLHLLRVPGVEEPGTQLSAIRLDGLPGGFPPMLVDGLAFFQARTIKLPPMLRPSRAIAPQEGQSSGMHSGEGVLPFPNVPSGMRPAAASAAGWNEVVNADDAVDFVHHSEQGDLRFRLRAKEPARRIEAAWNDQPVLLPLDGVTLGRPLHPASTLDVRRVDDHVWIRDPDGGEYTFSITGRVLRVDIRAAVTGGHIGWERPPAGVTALDLPFLNAGANAALPMWAFDAASPASNLFAWAGFDLTRSAATRLQTTAGAQLMHYDPRADGETNQVFETIWIAVSPDPLEVLPGVPTTNSVQSLQAWRTGAVAMDEELIRADLPGPAAAAVPVDRRSMDLALASSPFDEGWSEPLLAVGADGQLQRTTSREFRLKPAIGLQQGKASNAAAPAADDVWNLVDYDERCAGSAGFVQNSLLLGEWLHASRSAPDAPAVSGGEPGWLLSGVAGQGFCRTPVSRLVPFLPLATHARLNASSMLFAPGLEELRGFVLPPGADEVDVLTATAITYGMAARGVSVVPADLVASLRSIHMVSHLQPRFCAAAARISYFDGTRLVTLPKALQTGAWRRSQIYVQMPCGLEMWINGSAEPWEVRQGRDTHVLPPFGHVAAAGDGFRQMSVLRDGRRVDFVEDGLFRFFAPRGPGPRFEGVLSNEPVLLHADAHGFELLWPGKPARCEIPAAWLAGVDVSAGEGAAMIRPSGEYLVIEPKPGATSVRWKSTAP